MKTAEFALISLGAPGASRHDVTPDANIYIVCCDFISSYRENIDNCHIK